MNRQEAIEYIQEWLKDEYALNGKDRVVLNMAIEALQQKRPKGKWIDKSNGTFCSECNYKTNEYYNYCPVCGADIENEEFKIIK